MSVVGCGAPEGEAPEQAAISTARQALLNQFELAIGFPAGFSQGNVALHASQSLRIAGGVTLQDVNGAPAPAVNVGTGLLEVNAATSTGSLISGGNVWLGSQSEATGTVQAAGTITKQAGADVIGTELPATPLGPLGNLRFTVDFPSLVNVPAVGPDTTSLAGPGRLHERLCRLPEHAGSQLGHILSRSAPDAASVDRPPRHVGRSGDRLCTRAARFQG